jgi:hypothetical protein
MSLTRCRCQAFELEHEDDWLPRRAAARDLLPWADPYIAGLIHQLERRYDLDHDDMSCDPFVADDAPCSPRAFDDGWQDDAFMPRPLGASRQRWLAPVFGGFPLLDDSESIDDLPPV